MLPIRIAVATRYFQQPLRQAVQTARNTGADAVQLDARNEVKPSEFSDTGRRQFLHLLQESGLAVASLVYPMRRSLFDPDRLEDRLDGIRQTMQFAYEMKAKVVTARVGRVPAADSSDFQVLTEVVNELARHGNQVGVTLAITPSSDSAEALAGLLQQVTQGPIGVNFDPAVFVMSGQKPDQAYRALYDYVAHVQVRDAVRDMDGSGLEVPLGRGEVDWEKLLALLEEANYREWMTVERSQGDDKIGDMTRAIQYLRRVVSG